MPSYSNYPMVLNRVFLGMLDLRSDQINYFDIPDATAEELALAKTAPNNTSFQRNLHSARLDNQTPTRQVQVRRRGRSRERSKFHLMRGGRAILVPTELLTTPPAAQTTNPGAAVIRRPSVRFTTIKFPGAADTAEIGAWLHLKLVNHKPKYFKVPGGRVYNVAPFTGGVVTGEDTTP